MFSSETTTDNWELKIVDWCEDRNLVEGSTSKDQMCKLIQEVGELSDAICKNNHEELEKELGDCLVVLVLIAEQNQTTINRCMRLAYEKIKDRKGVMRDGIFIKQEDL